MYDLNNLKRSNTELFSLNNLILNYLGIQNGIKFLAPLHVWFSKAPDGSVIKIILNSFMYHAWLLYICFCQVRFSKFLGTS